MMKLGNPVGMSPRVGAPVRNKLTNVPIIRAARGGGTILASRAGHLKAMSSVNSPRVRATKFGSATARGISISAPMVPLSSGSWPSRREVCSAMIIHPMPLMNPDITGYGTNRIYCPSFKTPRATCIAPARTTVVNTKEGLPSSVA